MPSSRISRARFRAPVLAFSLASATATSACGRTTLAVEPTPPSADAAAPPAHAPTASDAAPPSDSSSKGEPMAPPQARSSVERTVIAPTPEKLAPAVTANNQLATKLLGALAKPGAATNLVTSPISASLALGMVYGGARGTTATEMATALSIPEGAGDAFFDAQNALSTELAARGGSTPAGFGPDAGSNPYVLDVADAVWAPPSIAWASAYIDLLARSYGTGVYLEDFAAHPDASRATVNGWVSDRTRGLIPSLFGPDALDASTTLVLVNAVYLKFAWLAPFAVAGDKPFTRGDGSKIDAPSVTGRAVAYREDANAQVAWLPLVGGSLHAFVALPKTSLAKYEATLSPRTFTVPAPFDGKVTVTLPKLDLKPDVMPLGRALEALGMRRAFTREADFTGMSTKAALLIGAVLQQATLQLDENGIVASAATGVVMTRAAAMQEKKVVHLDVNRPYVIGIVDQKTDAILFLGHVGDPAAKK